MISPEIKNPVNESPLGAESPESSALPREWVVFVETARLFYRHGQYEKAQDIYQCLHQVMPDNATVLTALGACRQMCGDFDAAIQFYRQALARKGDEVCALVNMAECLIRIGHRNVARALLYRAINLDERGAAGRRSVKLLARCVRSIRPWEIHSQPSHSSPVL